MNGHSDLQRRSGRSGSARIHTALTTAAVALLAITAGCGASENLANYMAKGLGGVVMIQWQATSSGQLRGTFTSAIVSGTPPYMRVSSSSTPFTGTISGRSVILDFQPRLRFFSGPAGPPPLAKIRGTVRGNALRLRVPRATRNFTLAQAGLSAYNAALAHLRLLVHRANSGSPAA
jgi:hypothetical protein